MATQGLNFRWPFSREEQNLATILVTESIFSKGKVKRVVNNNEHIERIRMVVEHLHNCSAVHSATMSVHEVFRGQTVWKGDVEAFALSGHPKARRAYGWSEGKGDKERFFAVLEIPPVKSAQDAVKASIVADIKNAKGKI